MNNISSPQLEYLDFLVRSCQLSLQGCWQNLEPNLRSHLLTAFEFQLEKAYTRLGEVQQQIEIESYFLFGDEFHCYAPEGEREQAYYRRLVKLEAEEKSLLNLVIARFNQAIDALEGVSHE